MTERICRFAGTFFPADAEQLANEVAAHLRAAEENMPAGNAAARAIVSAHAGYAYSGRFAGLSFASVGWTPARVVVISPSHRHWFQGIAYPSQDGFSTPLGQLRIDRAACTGLADAGLAHEENAAHDNEHGIETQLPFIRALWPEVQIVPLVCGDVAPKKVAAAIDTLGGPKTLFVLSSDLSHFLTRKAALEKDAETAHLLETGKADALTPYHACGATGLQGWLMSRAGGGTKALRLGMGDSSETTGDCNRVVGYGAWAFYPIDSAMLNQGSREELLDLARASIKQRLGGSGGWTPKPEQAATPLHTVAASFVTLMRGGELRGCIGSIAARRAMASDVAENAIAASFRDPRFAPVTADLLPKLTIKIAVLSKAQRLPITSEKDALSRIEPGMDGLILSAAGRRSTLLPAVWKSLPEPRAFLEALKLKAGLPGHYWDEDVVLHRFRAESFEEAPELSA